MSVFVSRAWVFCCGWLYPVGILYVLSQHTSSAGPSSQPYTPSQPDTHFDIPPEFGSTQHSLQGNVGRALSIDQAGPAVPLREEAGPLNANDTDMSRQDFALQAAALQAPYPPAPNPSSRYTSRSTFGQPQQQPQLSAPADQLSQNVDLTGSYESAQTGEKKLGEGYSESSSYPNTPDRSTRAPPAASPDYVTPQGSSQSSITPSDAEGMY